MYNEGMKRPLALNLLLLSVACCTEIAPEPAPEPPPLPAEESVPPPGNTSETLRIGPEGVAGLRGITPFTVVAIEAAFPGHTIIMDSEGIEAVPVFLVKPEGSEKTRFLVRSDWSRGFAGEVSTRDPSVVGPLGEIIGQAKLQDLPADARSACKRAEPSPVANLICPDQAAPLAFQRVYLAPPEGAPPESAVLVGFKYLPPVPSP